MLRIIDISQYFFHCFTLCHTSGQFFNFRKESTRFFRNDNKFVRHV